MAIKRSFERLIWLSALLVAPIAFAAPSSQSPLQSGIDALRTSDYARAEQTLSAVKGADEAKAKLLLARVRFETGRYAEADKLADSLERTAEKIGAITLRAEIAARAGKIDDAIKSLETLVRNAQPADVPLRRPRLLLAELLVRRGRRADAEPYLVQFAKDYSDDVITSRDSEGLAAVGRAMHLHRHVKDANRAYNESERAERGRLETLFFRAELFVDTYDAGHAEEVLRDALKIAPNNPDAQVMLARVKLEQTLDFEEAEKLAKKALAINPKHPGAIAVLVGIALRDMDIAGAERQIAEGLRIAPSDLELLSLRAAARFLDDDKPGYEQAKKAVFAENKEYSAFFGIVGELAEWEHRYDDIVAMMKEATQIDPKDGKAWAQLGLMQMRAGDEAAGMVSLEEAWKFDKFNVRAFNTLERLYKEWIPNAYDTEKTSIFTIRYPKDERKLLERYVPKLVASAWSSMKNRYGFAPVTPLQVELYASRQHFSVRTHGLPNIGIQGVCFGKTLASMSPRSEPFNWGNVLWHEIGHVFAIQLSKNHVPRWFTEGLSEYETIIKRPEWNRELDQELFVALKKGALPSAVDMNTVFTHPGTLDIGVAYYAASQMIVYTADRFGMNRITEALKLWGQGVRTPEVITRAFGVPPKEYDAGFASWLKTKLARYDKQFVFDVKPMSESDAKALVQKDPNSADARLSLVVSLLRARKADDAKRELSELLKTAPHDGRAHFLAYKIASMTHDIDGASAHLDAMVAAGADGYSVQLARAEIAEEKKDKKAAHAALEKAHAWDPSQSEPLKKLIEFAVEEKNEDAELRYLRKFANLEQHDRRAWAALLSKLVKAKRFAEAREVGEAALFVDVSSPRVHLDYGRALAALAEPHDAMFEFESALLADPSPKDAASAHALLARTLVAPGANGANGANGDAPQPSAKAEAKRHLDEARKLDPSCEEAKDLAL